MKEENFNYALIKSQHFENDSGYSNNFEIISKLNWKKIYPYPLKEIQDNPIWYLLKPINSEICNNFMFLKLIIKDIFFDKNICKYDKEYIKLLKILVSK